MFGLTRLLELLASGVAAMSVRVAEAMPTVMPSASAATIATRRKLAIDFICFSMGGWPSSNEDEGLYIAHSVLRAVHPHRHPEVRRSLRSQPVREIVRGRLRAPDLVLRGKGTCVGQVVDG